MVLLAYEPRMRHMADRRREAEALRRLDSAQSRILAELRTAVAFDIEGFLEADGNPAGSSLTCQNGRTLEGFVVSRADDRIGTRSLAIDLDAGTLTCCYETRRNSIGTTERRVLDIDMGNGGSAMALWEAGSAHTFATVDALSAFLLTPIFSA